MTKSLISIITIILSSILLFQTIFAIEWFENPYFINPVVEFDVGGYNEQGGDSPDGWKWGYSYYTWNGGGGPIEAWNIRSYEQGTNDYNVHMYGRDNSGRIGVVTLIQGNVWGGVRDNTVPPKLPVNMQDIYVETWLKRSWTWPSTPSASTVIYMMDIWLIDESTEKKMVLDLNFWSNNIIPFTWVDNDNQLHYSAQLACVLPSDIWSYCAFELSPYIDAAISNAASRGITYNKDSMYIYQAEVLIEVKGLGFMGGHAEGNLDVGNLRLYTNPCYSDSDCNSPYVCDLDYNKCVKCDSNHKEVGGFDPNNKCEEACGADSRCDEYSPEWQGNCPSGYVCSSSCQCSKAEAKPFRRWRRPYKKSLSDFNLIAITIAGVGILIVLGVMKFSAKKK